MSAEPPDVQWPLNKALTLNAFPDHIHSGDWLPADAVPQEVLSIHRLSTGPDRHLLMPLEHLNFAIQHLTQAVNTACSNLVGRADAPICCVVHTFQVDLLARIAELDYGTCAPDLSLHGGELRALSVAATVADSLAAVAESLVAHGAALSVPIAGLGDAVVARFTGWQLDFFVFEHSKT